jgi:polyisoprenoid-binding protein YceI
VTTEPTATSELLSEPGILRTFELVPEDSEVRFLIDEELLGSPKTVVGRTNQVSGEILLDLKNPQVVEVGTIQVDARDLTTDDSFRNRALRRQILDSAQDEYQYITFIPTEIDGLTREEVEIGETQIFSLTGDLQIRDIVQSVTFEMMVTVISASELRGSGEAIVLRSDFDLQIPSVPGVANVSDEVKLEIDFSAEST